jgi:hypothetical protein
MCGIVPSVFSAFMFYNKKTRGFYAWHVLLLCFANMIRFTGKNANSKVK